MAGILPFRGWRFDPARVPALSQVVTQPYDRITPALEDRYLAASPHNIVRVILPRKEEADTWERNAYTRADATLFSWMKEGILRQDPVPSVYPYFQTYKTPDGKTLTRRAFIAGGVLEPFGPGVRAHENTLAGPKADRLSLIRALGASCELIFMLYDDPKGEVNRLLDAMVAGLDPREATDEDGNAHRVWAVEQEGGIRTLQEMMRPAYCLIADGHHRYETALNYQREQRDRGQACAGPETYDAVPVAYVALQDPGLTILPTHRAVHSLQGFDPNRLIARLGRDFNVTPLRGTGGKICVENTDRWTFSVAFPNGQAYRLKLKRDDPEGAIGGENSPDWKRCDAAVLHSLVLEPHLGIGAKEMENESHLHYHRDPEEAFQTLRNGKSQAVFFVPATPIADVMRVSARGERMPQKSTDFYPKLLSGLVVYKIAF